MRIIIWTYTKQVKGGDKPPNALDSSFELISSHQQHNMSGIPLGQYTQYICVMVLTIYTGLIYPIYTRYGAHYYNIILG
jgi:hypothetical protein